jgi:amino acid adenylation domain-containing protein
MTIDGLIADAARQHPTRIAVEGLHGDLTYTELDSQADNLAQYLFRSGVRQGDIVGISLRRDPEMIVAVLAILKAGAAYMPIDANYPVSRTESMLRQAGVRFILSASGNERQFAGAEVIAMPRPETLSSFEGSSPKSAVDSVACLLFTSGSTGDPKGILLSHESISSYVRSVQESTPLDQSDRVLQFATISFDAFAEEVFPCLARGATLVLMPRPQDLSLWDFTRYCDSKRITFMVLTTGYWNAFVDEIASNPSTFPKTIRTVVFGGERAQRRWVDCWCKVTPPSVRLVNAYGPTETTIAVTHYLVPRNFLDQPGNGVPVGFALANADIRLLDENFQDVTAGQTGEVFIGGSCVANGYINNEKLTEEKFVTLKGKNGREEQRFYRSADLARVNERGELEILGRLDDQIKVRGFLVEPIEIERALDATAGIKGAVVKMWPDPDGLGAGVLTAYVLAEDVGQFDAEGVRAQLRLQLPDYMVPSQIIALDVFPLAPNGKVQRDALPQPDFRSHTTPGNAFGEQSLEDYLSVLWSDLVGADDVDPDDNFFEIGGNSLIAARMVGQVQKKLASTIYMVAIFEFPSVKLFAGYLRKNYAASVKNAFQDECLDVGSNQPSGPLNLEAFRARITSFLPRRTSPVAEKNARALFVLSPPRSGSTLTRILLGGHPKLFAPPELQLLLFDNLADRSSFFQGRMAFYLEGALRALMEARSISFDEANFIINSMTLSGITTKEFYTYLQESISPAMLVDKSASYAMDPWTLSRMEEDFEEPFYIHLVRHPAPTIRSYIETRQDQGSFFYDHELDVQDLAELVWLTSHENIVSFLKRVPPDRQYRLRYETLVEDPEKELRLLCAAIGLSYAPEMLDAYDHRSRRMTDPARPGSLMVGDTKFHEHKGIEKQGAQSAATDGWPNTINDLTQKLAQQFGYDIESSGSPVSKTQQILTPRSRNLVALKREGNDRPIFMVHGSGGSVPNFRFLSSVFTTRPFFALQAPGLEEKGEIFPNLQELAGRYIETIRSEQTSGPYLIGGWSFGGIAAWEIAQQLSGSGQEVALLTLIDSFPPEHFVIDEAGMMLRFVNDFCTGLGKTALVLDRERLIATEQQAWPHLVMRELVIGSIVDSNTIDANRFEQLYKVYRSHVHAAQSYYPDAYCGRVLNLVTADSLLKNPHGIWSKFGDLVATAEVPGDHFSCLVPPNVSEVGKVWHEALSKA